MILKFGERNAYINFINGNINVKSDGVLTMKEFLSHEAMNSALTKDELEQRIDCLETEIRDIEEQKDRQELILNVLKYKDGEAKLIIENNLEMPF